MTMAVVSFPFNVGSTASRNATRKGPKQGRKTETHVQFLAGARPVATVVEPPLAQVVPVSLGGEGGGHGVLAGAARQDSPADPQDQPGQLSLREVR